MIVHFALGEDTACGKFIGNPSYRLKVDGEEAGFQFDYTYEICIQHTSDKDLVTCKSCQKTKQFKEHKDDSTFCDEQCDSVWEEYE